MTYKEIIIKIFIINIMSFFISAYAIEWSKAPLACLPERAEKWTDTSNIPLCHCPPQDYCPEQGSILPEDVELIVEWHFFNGVKQSGKLIGTDITTIKDGTIKVQDIFKYTPEQIKELVYQPILTKFKIDTKKAYNQPNGYVKDTMVTIILKQNSALQAWVNNTLKLPNDIAAHCCDSVCPDGFSPNFKNVEVVDPNAIMVAAYTMTAQDYTNYKNGFYQFYEKTKFYNWYNETKKYNANMSALDSFYNNQASLTNLESLLNIVKSFMNNLPWYSWYFYSNYSLYNNLNALFSDLQKKLQDELNRRNEPTKYISVETIACTVTTTYSREGCLHGGTNITMADGTFKTIETLKLGDEVKGNHGVAKVIALSKFTQKEDRMYSINGGKAFFTVEHPVLTPQGWKSVDATVTSVKSNAKIIGTLHVGDIILMDGGKQLKVTSIKEEVMKGGIDAYNLSVTGDGSFIANGFIMKSFKQMQMHY